MHTTSRTRRAGAAALLAAAALTTAGALTTSTATAAATQPAAAQQPYYEVWEPGQHQPPHPTAGVHVPRPDTTTTDTDGPHAVGPSPPHPPHSPHRPTRLPRPRCRCRPAPPPRIPCRQALIGHWTPADDTTAGRAFVEFTPDGHWTGSDGCNHLTGTWGVHTDGTFTATANPTTLMTCENIPIADWLTQTSHADITNNTLVPARAPPATPPPPP
ncbi:META domain-containing protein [Pseudonocardia sp. Ae717_Ps2]|uniref:META domain-containing protein n=1 Tax=Pseudonocardia sp. Ae717_Ps2 TaxID=1885573 RepID=UPI00094B30CD|nr:META domain-containing protein [Pseudonocardia sp. Ae717_Ps2]